MRRGGARWHQAVAALLDRAGQRLPSFVTLAKLLAALECPTEEFTRYFGPFGNVETMQRHKL
jgi:hypothetical protein